MMCCCQPEKTKTGKPECHAGLDPWFDRPFEGSWSRAAQGLRLGRRGIQESTAMQTGLHQMLLTTSKNNFTPFSALFTRIFI
jgi:hypothetical protein